MSIDLPDPSAPGDFEDEPSPSLPSVAGLQAPIQILACLRMLTQMEMTWVLWRSQFPHKKEISWCQGLTLFNLH